MKSCEVCGYSFRTQDSSRMHVHHMRPTEHGGPDTSENKITLCPNCHSVAHILLSIAVNSLGAVDLRKLYLRDHLILSILQYHRRDYKRELRTALINLWRHKWIRLKLHLKLSKSSSQAIGTGQTTALSSRSSVTMD